mmetsp:Transcript_18725/g.22422  ORF Transcript_18725/g.22422 Transcript_18725/m.22422 type:complete len:274 (-) Transcript_18725:23-844(-)
MSCTILPGRALLGVSSTTMCTNTSRFTRSYPHTSSSWCNSRKSAGKLQPTNLRHAPKRLSRPAGPRCELGAGLEGVAAVVSSSPVFQAYTHSLEAHPLVTKCATSGTVFTVSDLVAQLTFERSSGGVDGARIARFGLFGLVVHAPLFAFFFKTLDGLIDPLQLPGLESVGVKVAIDQLLWTPPFLAFLFYVQTAVLQGKGSSQGVEKVRQVLVPTLKVNWRIWVPANVVNYTLPADLRILWINLISLGFVVYLSTVANTETPSSQSSSSDTSS